MHGHRQAHAARTSFGTLTPFTQEIGNTGFQSFPQKARAAVTIGRLRKPASSDTAEFSLHQSERAAPVRRLDRMETKLQRTSSDLLNRLPFDDAVKLAALVGTGWMTWPEIHAALDARIKLATANALKGHEEDRNLPMLIPYGPRDAQEEWEDSRRNGEDEIWARYHAQCDEVFADDSVDMDSSSLEQLWSRERILDRLRSARDRELALLRQQLGAQPPRPAPFSAGMKASRAANPRTRLTSAESDALSKLDATGFIGSAGMIAAIDGLATECAATSRN